MIKAHAPRGSSGIRTAAILVAVIAVLYLARQILIPLAFAITLTLILSPTVMWLRRMRLGRVPAVLLVMVVSIAAAGGISRGTRELSTPLERSSSS
jgi:predicted PurR-regulated permease PerM